VLSHPIGNVGADVHLHFAGQDVDHLAIGLIMCSGVISSLASATRRAHPCSPWRLPSRVRRGAHL